MVVSDMEALPEVWVASLLVDCSAPCNSSHVLPNVGQKSCQRPSAYAWHSRDAKSGKALVEGVGLEEIFEADLLGACQDPVFSENTGKSGLHQLGFGVEVAFPRDITTNSDVEGNRELAERSDAGGSTSRWCI